MSSTANTFTPGRLGTRRLRVSVVFPTLPDREVVKMIGNMNSPNCWSSHQYIRVKRLYRISKKLKSKTEECPSILQSHPHEFSFKLYAAKRGRDALPEFAFGLV